MSQYIVSARKYRPDNFGTLIGQDNIAKTLKNSILRGQLAHAYLFCGPRGVGKTTTARIFAKMINCSNPSEDMEPCGECESCRSFAEGRSYCIHELDAASNNGVEDIKALIDQVRIAPQVGKYSVFIIDEVHMLSQAAFNAFLKTLEEPPAHAIFILATTEKHKILPTILSRCQTYDFNRISVEDIVRNLREIASKENINIDSESLHIIAQKADGAMRDALTIFDQTIAFCGTDVKYEDVMKNLNILSYEYSFSLVENFLKGDYAAALLTLDEVLSKGFNALHFVSALSSHLRNLIVSKSAGLEALLELPDSLKLRYRQQAELCSVKFLYDALAITTLCESGYKASINPRLHIEFTLMKLCFLSNPPAVQATAPAATKATPAAATKATPATATKATPATAQAAAPTTAAKATATVATQITPAKATQATAAAGLAEAKAEVNAEPKSAVKASIDAEVKAEPKAEVKAEPKAEVEAIDINLDDEAELAPTPTPAAAVTRRRRGAVAPSISMKSILASEEKKTVVQESDVREDKPLEEEIRGQWKTCAAIYKDKPRLANAIESAELRLEEDGDEQKLTFLVSNDAQVKWIRDNALSSLEAKFQELLRWKKIRLDVAMTENAATSSKAYTPEEKYKEMTEDHPGLTGFTDSLGATLK